MRSDEGDLMEKKKQTPTAENPQKSENEATAENEVGACSAQLQEGEVQASPTGVKGFFAKIGNSRFCRWWMSGWRKFKEKHPNVAQFLIFFILSNGVTVLQMILMPLFKLIFNQTALIDVNFQIGKIGKNFNGTDYFMFDYAAGALPNGGGGLAYFLSVQITLAIAQVINFFAQRNVTFKSKSNIYIAALWYLLAYICISIVAAALQGLYKGPIYNLFMQTLHMGNFGQTLADIITMIINSAISFWVFFPIFKIIFKDKKSKDTKQVQSLEVMDEVKRETTTTQNKDIK